MNMRKKERKFPWGKIGIGSCILVVLFIIFCAFGGYKLFVITRTNFSSYEKFRKIAYSDFFQEEAPESAENIEYYYSTGQYDSFIAVAYDLSEGDSEELKKYYEDWYTRKGMSSLVIENSDVPNIIREDEKMNFLENLAGEDIQNMQMYVYIEGATENVATINGVMGDSQTGRVVVFECEDSVFLDGDNYVSEYIEQKMRQ